MTKWISNFPSWILSQLGIVNRGGDYRPHLLDTVLPVVIIEEEEEGAGDLFSDAETENAFGARVNVGLIAAQYAYAQLKNPPGSSKVVFLDIMTVSNPTAAVEAYTWGMKDADLTTDAGVVVSKDSDGADGVSHGRSQNNAAELLDSIFGGVSVPASNSSVPIIFNPPVRLTSGSGFAIRGLTLAASLIVTFQLREYVEE